MTLLTTLAIGLLQALPVPAALPPPLFIVQDLPDANGTVTKRALVRVALDREHRCSLDTIVTKDQRFFGHFGGHYVWDESYVATRSGGVIDTLAKQVINDVQHGELLGFEAPRVIYRVHNGQETNSIYAFDLRSKTVEKLASPGHWKLFGGKSPDKQKGVGANGAGLVVVIQLAAAEVGRDKTAIDIHCPRDVSLSGETFQCLWLDDERILTHAKAGELLLSNINGNIAPWLTIDGAKEDRLSRPRLTTDRLGRIIYRCGNADYLIDVKAQAASKLEWHALGHDFEASAGGTPRAIRYLGKEIGRWECDPYAVQTAPGLIALPFRKTGEPGARYLAVWSLKRGEWQVQNILVNNVIGWGP